MDLTARLRQQQERARVPLGSATGALAVGAAATGVLALGAR